MATPFQKRFGAPSPAVDPLEVALTKDLARRDWQKLLRRTGSGWFMDRFLLLFGEELQELRACLDAWPFLVRPGKERVVIGRNAYGSLLVLEEPDGAQQVCLLDPIRVVYWTDPNLDLPGLIGFWLPKNLVPHFLDDGLYQSIVRGEAFLPDGNILACQKPEGAGGEMTPDNFQEEEIVDYYRTTGPIYAKAFARKRKRRK